VLTVTVGVGCDWVELRHRDDVCKLDGFMCVGLSTTCTVQHPSCTRLQEPVAHPVDHNPFYHRSSGLTPNHRACRKSVIASKESSSPTRLSATFHPDRCQDTVLIKWTVLTSVFIVDDS
jgi:hypothetical protein